MFGRNSKPKGPSGFKDEDNNSTSENYLKLAESAQQSGDESLAAHLYLAAFEAAQDDAGKADGAYVEGLRHAWHTACKRKERSLAEYIYEKLEPFSSEDELKNRTEQLQDMTLEKLEEYGFSHDELQGMADALSGEVLNLGGGAELAAFMPAHAHAQGEDAEEDEEQAASDEAASGSDEGDPKDSDDSKGEDEPQPWRISFNDLVGFDSAIQAMHERGIGMAEDEGFQSLLEELNVRHGVDRMPFSRTVLLRSDSRDDANHFMVAIAGEVEGPAVRMYMDRNPQGLPVLCVMTSPDFKWRPRNMHAMFEGIGALLLEDIDTWGEPFESPGEGFEAAYSQLTRGAREAVNFIRSCVENPDVMVAATCSASGELEPFFQQMLEPADVVDIEEPTREERAAVWQHVCELHPSIRAIDREMLVACSAHLSRSDIYATGLAAVEDAYREGVRARKYLPVSRQNIYEKLAAFQPVDSEEYAKLENTVVAELRRSIEAWEDGPENEGGAIVDGGER